MDQDPTGRPIADDHRCPLCGGDNQCAVAAGRPVSECWCRGAVVTNALLERLAAADRGTRCICQQCINNQGETISEG